MKNLTPDILSLLVLASLAGCQILPGLQSSPTQVPTPAQPSQADSRPAASPTAMTFLPLPTEDLAGLPSLADLPEGWSQIEPGGETSCARGGTYSFFVRKTSSDRLLLYFEGGGSCYDAQTCRPGAKYFDDEITTDDQSDNPALKRAGVFALEDERNPFKDYNIVFISYCTGDAFMGTRPTNYTDGKNSFTVNQVGYINTRRTLGWTYQNFPDPDQVFAIGCSAGVVGSFFHAPYLAAQYQNIPLILVGDSGAGYLDGPASFVETIGAVDVLPNWLPGYQNLISDGMIKSSLIFVLPALSYPEARFGLLDTQEDSVQGEIVSRFNNKINLGDLIESNLQDIRKDAPDFVSYTGPGNYHCITMHPDFVKYEVGGVKLVDWFASLAAGQPVDNIKP